MTRAVPHRPIAFAEMLKVYRLFRGLTVRGLARTIGISPATLCRLEAGRMPDAETLLKLVAWMLR